MKVVLIFLIFLLFSLITLFIATHMLCYMNMLVWTLSFRDTYTPCLFLQFMYDSSSKLFLFSLCNAKMQIPL